MIEKGLSLDFKSVTDILESKPEAGIHYCTSLVSATNKVIRAKMIKSETKSLKEYIKEYQNMFNQLKEVISQ